MKTFKILTLLSAVLISCTSIMAQEKAIDDNGFFKQVIQIKINESLVEKFDALHQVESNTPNTIRSIKEGVVELGIPLLDKLNQRFEVTEYERTFNYSPKFEDRHRQFGLHKWYEIHYSSSHSTEEVVKAYKEITSLENSAPIPVRYTANSKPVDDSVSEKGTPPPDPKPSGIWIPDDNEFNKQYNLHNTAQYLGWIADSDIDLPEAWWFEKGSEEIVIAIIDEGIDYNHQDLVGNMWYNDGEIPDNNIDDDNNGYVDDYYGYNFYNNSGTIIPEDHGTHVAGIAGAESNNADDITNGYDVAGVAGGSGNNDGCRLMALQAIYNDVANSSSWKNAIIYAADMGARIANLSFGGLGYDQAEKDAIDYFLANAGGNGYPAGGGIAVAAMANTNANCYPYMYPAAYDNTIAVGMSDYGDGISCSNYVDEADIYAPGHQILSTIPNNTTDYMTGTSMATPHVSGVAALMLSINPDLDQTSVKRILNETADIISYGALRINAWQAVWQTLGTTMSINGNPIVCESEAYFIENLPKHTTVNWSLTGTSGGPLELHEDTPENNECTLTNNPNYYTYSTNLLAEIEYLGKGLPPLNLFKELHIDDNSLAQSGTYEQESCACYNESHPALIGTLPATANSPVYLYECCMTEIHLDDMHDRTVNFTGSVDPLMWWYSNNTLYLQLPHQSGGIPFTFSITGDGACNDKSLLFFSMSKKDNKFLSTYSISPNPVENDLTITAKRNDNYTSEDASLNAHTFDVNIYKIQSKELVFSERMLKGFEKHTLNLSKIDDGYYIIEITNSNDPSKYQTFKFYKE